MYETFNIASKWDLPLLVVLENNRYAQSTSQDQTLAGDIEARAAAFGIETAWADTWDPAALLPVAARCVEVVRTRGTPRFLRARHRPPHGPTPRGMTTATPRSSGRTGTATR